MNKKTRLAGSIAMVTLLTSSGSGAISAGWSPYKTYIGLDAQVRRMDFKGGFGDNLLQHHSPQGNVYVGIKFNDAVGIEGGYEATRTRTRDVTLHTGDIAAGAVVLPNRSPAVFKSKMKIKGPHLDLIGFYSFREDLPVKLIGSVGLSFFKATSERIGVSMGNPAEPGRIRTLSKRKPILRLMGGLEYKWNAHFGTRASIGLVKTGKLVIFSNDGLAGATPEIKPKDSTVYGLGVFWIF